MAENIENLVSDLENDQQINNQPASITPQVDPIHRETAITQLRTMNSFVHQATRTLNSTLSQNGSQVETKQEFESKMNKDSKVEKKQDAEKKVDLEKRIKVETIADLPQNLQEFLLDIDGHNTELFFGDNNIYRFAQTDSVNARTHGFTPLMVMILFNRADLAEEFIKFEGVDLTLSSFQTPVQFSTFEGSTALSILLKRLNIQYGLYVLASRLRPNEEQTEREFLLVERFIRLCPALMDHRQGGGLYEGSTELSWSSANDVSRSLRCFKLFRQYGTNMDMVDGNGETPFLNAVKNVFLNTICDKTRLEMFSYLVNCDINIQIGDPDLKGNLLHHYVYYRLSPEIAAYLLSLGVKYDCLNLENKTPLELTQIPKDQYPEKIREGFEFHVHRWNVPAEEIENVLQRNLSILTAMLHHIHLFYSALRTSDTKTIREYIANDLPLSIRNRHGRTPLHEWCYAKFEITSSKDLTGQGATKEANEIAKLFFLKGASLTVLDDANRTPLDAASESNNSLAQKALMNIIQSVINKKILYLRTEHPDVIKTLKQALNTKKVSYDNFNQISSYYFGFIYKFAKKKGLNLIFRGIQTALNSPGIEVEAERILKARAEASNGNTGLIDTLVAYGSTAATMDVEETSSLKRNKIPTNSRV